MKIKDFEELKKKHTSLKIKCLYANGLIKLTDKQLDSLIEKKR